MAGWGSPEGAFLGVVDPGDDNVPYDSGPGRLLGASRDGNGVEYVQLYALAG